MNHVPAFYSGDVSDAVTLAQRSPAATSGKPSPTAPKPATSRSAGCASVICGPGDIAQAHRPDEFILPSELDRCMGFLAKLAERLREW